MPASTTTLPGFTAAETTVMAAAWYHARSADVDFDRVKAHVSSKSIASVRERLRLCRAKNVQIEGVATSSASAPTPPDGANERASGTAKSSLRKTGTNGTAKKRKVIKVEVEDDNIEEDTEGSPTEDA